MKWIDLMSKESYLLVNKKLLRTVGMSSAIYLAALTEIMTAVDKKKTLDEAGMFPLDREYVEFYTGLTREAQYECDTALKKVGVIRVNPDDTDRISLDMDSLAALLLEEDSKNLKEVSKAVKIDKATKAKSKKAAQIEVMCARCDAKEADPELKELYFNWVKSVYTKNFLSYEIIDQFIDGINNFTPDKAVKIALLQIAISTSYKVPSYVINVYLKNVANRRTAPTSVLKPNIPIDTTYSF